MVNPSSLPKQLVIACIRAYRFMFSVLLGNRCRFEPSCSAYAMEALNYHGFIKGFYLTVKRLMRCHPWHPGGIDPIPYKANVEMQTIVKTEV